VNSTHPTLVDMVRALIDARYGDGYHDMALVHACDAIGKLRLIELHARSLRKQIETAWTSFEADEVEE
jgi:hypothetical protein